MVIQTWIFAGCVRTKKSTLEYIFLLVRKGVSWRSTKQANVASFTMKAELIACYEVINDTNDLIKKFYFLS